ARRGDPDRYRSEGSVRRAEETAPPRVLDGAARQERTGDAAQAPALERARDRPCDRQVPASPAGDPRRARRRLTPDHRAASGSASARISTPGTAPLPIAAHSRSQRAISAAVCAAENGFTGGPPARRAASAILARSGPRGIRRRVSSTSAGSEAYTVVQGRATPASGPGPTIAAASAGTKERSARCRATMTRASGK